jgi:putative addiction module killer protein
MLTIKRTPSFDAWFASLGTHPVRSRLLLRLRKTQMGVLDTAIPVGQGVYEMHEPVCPGWRLYYVQRGHVLVFMLGGDAHSLQHKDILAAQAVAAALDDPDQET